MKGIRPQIVPCDDGELDEKLIRLALTKNLARFKLPKRVFFVDALPRNAMGKVQKDHFRETYSATFVSA